MADWTTQAADAVERAVSLVRDKTVRPAQAVTKALVYGLLTAFFMLTAFALLAIGIFRGVVLATGDAWIAYFAIGGVFVFAGALCWSPRTRRSTESTTA